MARSGTALILGQRSRSGHPGRLVDVLVHVVVVALSGHRLDHGAEQDEAVVAVRPLGPRLELGAALAVELHVVGERAELLAVGVELGPEDVAGAAGVRQQLVDRDLGGDLPVGVVGEVRAEGRRELDLAGLDQLQDRDRREHLVHRPDPKARLDRVRDLPLAVGEPVGLAEQHLAVLGDQHRAAEPVRGGLLANEGLERRQGLRLGQPVRDRAGADRTSGRGRPLVVTPAGAARRQETGDRDRRVRSMHTLKYPADRTYSFRAAAWRHTRGMHGRFAVLSVTRLRPLPRARAAASREPCFAQQLRGARRSTHKERSGRIKTRLGNAGTETVAGSDALGGLLWPKSRRSVARTGQAGNRTPWCTSVRECIWTAVKSGRLGFPAV